jgi:hypothetical protein
MIDCMDSSMRMRNFEVGKTSKINYVLLFAGIVVGFVCYVGVV